MKNQFTPEQERWLSALEGGEYKQTAGALYINGAYCCLGVATHLHDPDHPALADGDRAPSEIQESLHLGSDFGAFRGDERKRCRSTLASLNDDGASFAEIAALIRAEPWLVFTNFDRPEDAA